METQAMAAEMSEEATTEAVRKAKAAYMREWSRKNRDKVQGYQRKYWAKKFKESEG